MTTATATPSYTTTINPFTARVRATLHELREKSLYCYRRAETMENAGVGRNSDYWWDCGRRLGAAADRLDAYLAR